MTLDVWRTGRDRGAGATCVSFGATIQGKAADGYEMTTYGSLHDVVAGGRCFPAARYGRERRAGRVGRAVASSPRRRIWIDRCRLEGDQDTFFARGYVSCVPRDVFPYIRGNHSFIFGPSIVGFDRL